MFLAFLKVTGLNINFVDNYCITLQSREDVKKHTQLLP